MQLRPTSLELGECKTFDNYNSGINPFFIVPARNQRNIDKKIAELERLNFPFLVICGEKVDHPKVVYHENAGKWDAINYAMSFLPEETNVVVLNDVDTEIYNFEKALVGLGSKNDIVYCNVHVSKGPQVKFYRILNPIRSRFHIAASGELMIMRKEVFKEVTPLPPCLAEDSYILFKSLELGYRANFCKEAYVKTERTHNAKEEAAYKNRTTLGIYQALSYATPPPVIRFFYKILPLIAPMLCIVGKDGISWTKGINRALKDYLTKKQSNKF